jgi:hypothetical protein
MTRGYACSMKPDLFSLPLHPVFRVKSLRHKPDNAPSGMYAEKHRDATYFAIIKGTIEFNTNMMP